MAFFFVEKSLAVGDQKLKVPQLGAIHIGVINLSEDPVPHREPDPARRGVGGAHAILASLRPARLDAGPAEGIARNLGILAHQDLRKLSAVSSSAVSELRSMPDSSQHTALPLQTVFVTMRSERGWSGSIPF